MTYFAACGRAVALQKKPPLVARENSPNHLCLLGRQGVTTSSIRASGIVKPRDSTLSVNSSGTATTTTDESVLTTDSSRAGSSSGRRGDSFTVTGTLHLGSTTRREITQAQTSATTNLYTPCKMDDLSIQTTASGKSTGSSDASVFERLYRREKRQEPLWKEPPLRTARSLTPKRMVSDSGPGCSPCFERLYRNEKRNELLWSDPGHKQTHAADILRCKTDDPNDYKLQTPNGIPLPYLIPPVSTRKYLNNSTKHGEFWSWIHGEEKHQESPAIHHHHHASSHSASMSTTSSNNGQDKDIFDRLYRNAKRSEPLWKEPAPPTTMERSRSATPKRTWVQLSATPSCFERLHHNQKRTEPLWHEPTPFHLLGRQQQQQQRQLLGTPQKRTTRSLSPKRNISMPRQSPSLIPSTRAIIQQPTKRATAASASITNHNRRSLSLSAASTRHQQPNEIGTVTKKYLVLQDIWNKTKNDSPSGNSLTAGAALMETDRNSFPMAAAAASSSAVASRRMSRSTDIKKTVNSMPTTGLVRPSSPQLRNSNLETNENENAALPPYFSVKEDAAMMQSHYSPMATSCIQEYQPSCRQDDWRIETTTEQTDPASIRACAMTKPKPTLSRRNSTRSLSPTTTQQQGSLVEEIKGEPQTVECEGSAIQSRPSLTRSLSPMRVTSSSFTRMLPLTPLSRLKQDILDLAREAERLGGNHINKNNNTTKLHLLLNADEASKKDGKDKMSPERAPAWNSGLSILSPPLSKQSAQETSQPSPLIEDSEYLDNSVQDKMVSELGEEKEEVAMAASLQNTKDLPVEEQNHTQSSNHLEMARTKTCIRARNAVGNDFVGEVNDKRPTPTMILPEEHCKSLRKANLEASTDQEKASHPFCTSKRDVPFADSCADDDDMWEPIHETDLSSAACNCPARASADPVFCADIVDPEEGLSIAGNQNEPATSSRDITVPVHETGAANLAIQVYGHAKGVWGLSKGLFVVSPFLGITEVVVSTVAGITTGNGDLNKIDHDIMMPAISALDRNILNPVASTVGGLLSGLVGRESTDPSQSTSL